MNNPVTEHESSVDRAKLRVRDIVSYIDAQVLQFNRQPTAKELVEELDRELGIDARWHLERALRRLLSKDPLRKLKQAQRNYAGSLLSDEEGLLQALRKEKASSDQVRKEIQH